MKLPGAVRALSLKLAGITERYGVRIRIEKNRFLTGIRGPQEDYTANFLTKPGDTEVVFNLSDFVDADKKAMPDWTNITTLSLMLIHQGRPIPLQGSDLVRSLDWTAAK